MVLVKESGLIRSLSSAGLVFSSILMFALIANLIVMKTVKNIKDV
jgi:hypothetical protein